MNNEISWPEIYADYIHPNNQGHKLCANLITLQLENIKASLGDFDGTIAEIPELEDDRYLNATCVNANSMGITARGCFKTHEDKTISSRRGWYCTSTVDSGSLTVMLPDNVKKARLLISMGGAVGSLVLTSPDGTTQKINAKKAPHATLIDIELDLTKLITITSELESGNASIYYIGIE